MTIANIEFNDYYRTIAQALNQIGAAEILAKQQAILIKPNLINDTPPPVTTPVECCGAIIDYIRSSSNNVEIVIAEGCGDACLETDEVFASLGYTALAEKHGIKLVDLNKAACIKLENSACPCFPHLYLPQIAFSHFVISVPVLKAHSLAVFTGALKNMMGFAPPKYYSGRHGSWKKAVFHGNMQQSITDLITYRKPELSIMDATVGLAEYHLGGRQCNPPVNRIIAGFDPFEVDREAAGLLGLDWRRIGHLVEKS